MRENFWPGLYVNMVLGLHILPEQLQCRLPLIKQVSGTVLEGWNTIIPKDIPSFGVLMMVMESTNKHIGPKFLKGVQLD